MATTLEQLGPTILSDLDGNPPLYVTKKRDQSGEHIYINDALILKSRSNIQTVNQNGKKQVSELLKFFRLFYSWRKELEIVTGRQRVVLLTKIFRNSAWLRKS